MMLSRIGRSFSRSSRSSLFNSTLGCDGYGARMAGIANQSGGIAPSNTEQGLGFLNAYFSSIGAAGKQSGPSFLPASRPGFANYSFARFLSSDITNKLDNEIKGGKGEVNVDDHKNVLRPLSPHLLIYRPQSNSTLSILHRVSGMYLTGAYLLFSLAYMKMGSICFTYPSFYQAVFYSSKLHLISLEIAALAFSYYVYHGIRHRSLDGVRQILVDYVHHGVTRNYILVLWSLFLIIVLKDSFVYLTPLN
ncbi:hypothetical protein SOVF_157430 [Spinacia oleracea]|uniref:Succinate dehydrogenase [ubiquinone] cytochrome b subunit, mitochondrial-like n=1 Tax=Spinacia oleracea TaxID=3562 RepID=A0A9R0HWW7_SPIOL|nr:succinate dehydrogenase [ubiquinone] cytochrome b subunit, mitochondrial-like [Spinacia oleracea]KNA09031.1 hypothetical protein SOVF_157430 [Spinacia oleracea]